MKKKLRIIISLLCVVMTFVFVLSACDTGSNVSSGVSNAVSATTSTGGVDENGYNSETKKYESANEVKNWDERELKILVLGKSYGTYCSEDFSYDEDIDGDVINDAVFNRNTALETKYNVVLKVVEAESGTVETMIKNDVDGGTKAYDIVMPYIRSAATLSLSGYLLDLSAYDTIDLSKPWWDQNFVSTVTMNGSLFLGSGDISLLNKICATAVSFNKEMITEYSLSNPYELVKNGTWTLDAMSEMGRTVLSDDGDGVLQYEGHDVFGLSSSYGDGINYYIGCNQNLCLKDENDYPYIAIGSVESIDIVQNIVTMLSQDWVIHAQEMGTDNIWDSSLKIFSEGRALFRTNAFSANKKLRDTTVNFGIVPLPKASEDQDGYYSFVATNNTVICAAITAGCQDDEFAAYMLEAAAVEGKNYLTPAYIDISLMQRDTRDDESQEMIEIIFANFRYDLNHIYNFGLSNVLQTLVQNGTPNEITSLLAENKSAVETKIDDVMEEVNKWSGR